MKVAAIIECAIGHGVPRKVVKEMLGLEDLDNPIEDYTMVKRRFRNNSANKTVASWKASRQLLKKRHLERVIKQVKEGELKNALMSFVSRPMREAPDGVISAEAYIKGRKASTLSTLRAVYDEYRPKLFGNKSSLTAHKNLWREVSGEATGDADAAKYAKMITDVYDGLVKEWHASGRAPDSIPRITEIHHVPKALLEAGVEKWKTQVISFLDQKETLRRHGTDASIDEVLDKAFDDIITGTRKVSKGSQEGSVSAAEALSFNNAESSLEYRKLYGSNDIVGDMLGTFDRINTDLGLSDVFGPDPVRGFKNMVKFSKESGVDPKLFAKDNKPESSAEKAFNELNVGREVANQSWASTMSTLRNVSVVPKTMGTLITSLADLPQIYQDAIRNGIKRSMAVQMPFKIMTQMLTGIPKERAKALGILCSSADHMIQQSNRFLNDDFSAANWTKKVSDLSYKASGITRWTDITKTINKEAILETLGNVRNSTYGALDPKIKKMLKRYDITDVEWEALRKGEFLKESGIYFLDPTKVENTALKYKLFGLLEQETDDTLRMASARERAIMNTGPAGSLHGEIGMAVATLSSFTLTNVMVLTRDFLQMSMIDRVKFAVFRLSVFPMFAFFSQQLRSYARGDSAKWDRTTEQWLEAYVGFVIDSTGIGSTGSSILKGEMYRIPERLAGPVIMDLSKLAQTGWNVGKAGITRDKKDIKKARSQATKFAGGLLPIPFYLKAPIQKLGGEDVKEFLAPGSKKKSRKYKKKLKKEGIIN